ncbi:hypothetical protein [Streptomyces luteireticuli]|uniref:hypothetical protein n=1 Tax=Streptomyces luteireticuli TaxID=173858 RepID=UPI003557CFA5
MSTFKSVHVSLAKKADAASGLPLLEMVRNLESRLFEVAREKDQLARHARSLEAAIHSKCAAIDGLLAQRDLLSNELGQLKGAVRDCMQEVFEDGDIDRDAADRMLEKLDLRPLGHTYRTEVTFGVTLEGLRREDGEPIHRSDLRELLEAHVRGKGVEFDSMEFDIQVDDHDLNVVSF